MADTFYEYTCSKCHTVAYVAPGYGTGPRPPDGWVCIIRRGPEAHYYCRNCKPAALKGEEVSRG